LPEQEIKEDLEAGYPDQGRGELRQGLQSVSGVRGLREVRSVRVESKENVEDSGRMPEFTLKSFDLTTG
jgi:hypothetical protein